MGSSKTERCIRGPKSALRLISSPRTKSALKPFYRWGRETRGPEKGNSRPRSPRAESRSSGQGFLHGGGSAGARSWRGNALAGATTEAGALTVLAGGIEPALHAGLLGASVSPALPLVGDGRRGSWPHARLPRHSPTPLRLSRLLPKSDGGSFPRTTSQPFKIRSRSSLSVFY